MKIGVLTYHDTANYGAALQTYATQEGLAQLGVDAEIIDYSNPFRRGSYGILKLVSRGIRSGQFASAAKALAASPLILRRKKRFDRFYRSRLSLSQAKYRTSDQLKAARFVYDFYLVGSDQVWNYHHNGGDMSYLLDFVQDPTKTISYASSFGLSTIADDFQQQYKMLLSRIRALSVREQIGADLVKSLTNRDVPVVLDPVFLLNKKQWEDIAADIPGVNKPYVLVYATSMHYYEKLMRSTQYAINGMHIANLTTNARLKDFLSRGTNVVFTSDPERFLGLIKHSELVLTSSFHGTAMSVIFQKQFVSFISGNSGKDARIVGLLDQLGLCDRISSNSMTAEGIDAPICYEAVQHRLVLLRNRSIGFLNSALRI